MSLAALRSGTLDLAARHGAPRWPCMQMMLTRGTEGSGTYVSEGAREGQRHSWCVRQQPARRCAPAPQNGTMPRMQASYGTPPSLPPSQPASQPAICPHWKGSTLPLDCACRTSTIRRGSSAWSRGPLQSTDGHAGIPRRCKRTAALDHPFGSTCRHVLACTHRCTSTQCGQHDLQLRRAPAGPMGVGHALLVSACNEKS